VQPSQGTSEPCSPRSAPCICTIHDVKPPASTVEVLPEGTASVPCGNTSAIAPAVNDHGAVVDGTVAVLVVLLGGCVVAVVVGCVVVVGAGWVVVDAA
jgi:hypothetical protein